MKTLRPIGNRVLVRKDKKEMESPGGIHLPENVAEHQIQTGIVVAVGDGEFSQSGEKIPMRLKEGDPVMFQSYAGLPVTLSGVKLLVLRETDIIGVLDADMP